MTLKNRFGHHLTDDEVIGMALFVILQQQEVSMAAIDDLKALATKLQADVDALLARPAPVPGTSDADITAVTAQLQGVDDKVVAANPPA